MINYYHPVFTKWVLRSSLTMNRGYHFVILNLLKNPVSTFRFFNSFKMTSKYSILTIHFYSETAS